MYKRQALRNAIGNNDIRKLRTTVLTSATVKSVTVAEDDTCRVEVETRKGLAISIVLFLSFRCSNQRNT